MFLKAHDPTRSLQIEKLTLGRLVWVIRRSLLRLSQQEFCDEILAKHSIVMDKYQLSKIENNRIPVTGDDFKLFAEALVQEFELDLEWVETIRQQTEVEELDLTNAIFPVYVKDLLPIQPDL